MCCKYEIPIIQNKFFANQRPVGSLFYLESLSRSFLELSQFQSKYNLIQHGLIRTETCYFFSKSKSEPKTRFISLFFKTKAET